MVKNNKLPYAYYQVSIKVILKNKEGKILLLKCIPGGSMPGFYDFPGGRINRSEISKPISTLIKRELREEIGSGIRYTLNEKPMAIGRHWYDSKILMNRQHILWILFEAYYMSGKIKISSEHTEYKWVKISKKNVNKYFTKGALQAINNYLTHKLQ